MAGYIPNVYKATLLEALAGKTATSTASLYLGLATALPDDPLTSTLANITEVATAGYARIAVGTWGSATTDKPVQIAVPAAFQFAAFSADMTQAAPYAFLTTAATGTAAPIRYIFMLAEPQLIRAGTPTVIPAGALIIE
jgi:hypothetical protein